MAKQDTALHNLNLAELHSGLQQKHFSSRELTDHYLQRIASHDAKFNSFISVDPEHARAQAAAADERLAQGENASLLGIPVAQKDIFCTRGLRTS